MKKNIGIRAKRNLKITAISVAAVLVLFFSLYGVGQIMLAGEAKKHFRGAVAESLWSAEQAFSVEAEGYTVFTAAQNQFTVLFISDTHFINGGWYGVGGFWTGTMRNNAVYGDIKALVEATRPDLIIHTGDLQTDKLSDLIYEEFCVFMDGFKIPWTFTFGNHDAEMRADKAEVARIISEAEYSFFRSGYTNLNGLGNDVILIESAEGSILFAFILADFGDWQKRKDPDKYLSTYDVGATDNQIEWYRWVCEGLDETAGYTVPSALVAHIPFHAYTYAVELGERNYGNPFATESEWGFDFYRGDVAANEFGQKETATAGNVTEEEYTAYMVYYRETGKRAKDVLTRAGYDNYKANSPFFSAVSSYGTRWFVSGHNHCDGYSYEFDGLTYVSVAKTGDIYTHKDWDGGNRGGTIATLKFTADGVTLSTAPLYK
ncbi:MAG: metallophosphoesterase [Clostridiaceae bacterium]|jgi:hypothetical protein|nr:metallophosphoesterase [Clostridiaceae bacterium]